MKDKTKLTKKDSLLVLGCAAFMLLNISAISSGGRGKAKRAVCLTNLRQLTLAWSIYAEDNDQKIVNGEAYGGGDGLAPVPTGGRHKGELWWTGDDVGDFWNGVNLPRELQERAIRAGALWSYCEDVKLYHCPNGYPGQMRNYSIVDSMNGLRRSGTYTGPAPKMEEGIWLWIKNRNQILRPHKRIVFIDEGRITPASYAVHYLNERWWAPPPMRHSDGTTLSFADGHTDYWKYAGMKTLEIGKLAGVPGRSARDLHQMVPVSEDDFQDLYRMQKGVWGRLGYVPSHQ